MGNSKHVDEDSRIAYSTQAVENASTIPSCAENTSEAATDSVSAQASKQRVDELGECERQLATVQTISRVEDIAGFFFLFLFSH